MCASLKTMRRTVAFRMSLVLGSITLWSSVASADGSGDHEKAKSNGHVWSESTRTLRLLQAADHDQDGRLSLVELQRYMTREVVRRVDERLPKLDRNGDGRVTRDEVPAMSAARFARFDLNGDGAFTLWELAQVMRQQALTTCPRVLARLDVDGDGALTANDVGGDTNRVARANTSAPRSSEQ